MTGTVTDPGRTMPLVRLFPFTTGRGIIFESQPCMATSRGEVGFVLHGPFEEREPGLYRVQFLVALGRGPLSDTEAHVATLDVMVNRGEKLIAEVHLMPSQLSHSLQTLQLDFEVEKRCELEYRVYATGVAPFVVCKNVSVEEQSVSVK